MNGYNLHITKTFININMYSQVDKYMKKFQYTNLKRMQECQGQLPWEKAWILADEHKCICSLFSSVLAMDLDNI